MNFEVFLEVGDSISEAVMKAVAVSRSTNTRVVVHANMEKIYIEVEEEQAKQ